MRALLLLTIISLSLLAACGDDNPGVPEPGEFPLDISFVNVDDGELLSAEIRTRIMVPGAVKPRVLAENRSLLPGDEFSLVTEAIPEETEFQVWFLVLAFWSDTDPIARWRVWTAENKTLQTAADGRMVFRWPDDRWNLDEVPWPLDTGAP